MASSEAFKTTRPRVCFLTDTFYPIVGGGETYARNISGRLAALGMSVFVITRRVTADLKPLDQVGGVPVIRVGPTGMVRFGKYAMLPAVALQLIRRRRSFDILYVSNFRAIGPAAVLMARLLGKRCILRAGVCGEFSGRYVAADGLLPSRALPWLAAPLALRTALLRRADRFVSNCESITAEFRQHGVSDSQIVQLPGGVDTEVFHPVEPVERARLRTLLGLPADRFLVGYAGKLNRGKGLTHLMAALPAILRRHPNIHLVLIGSGRHQFLSQEDELRAMVRDASLDDRVTFTGYVQNVAQYLQSLDLFVFPTEHEALPNALLEAMACGLICVGSRVGGVPDIIEDGVNGRLIPPGRPEAIVQALCAIKADPTSVAPWRLAARRTAEERFSLEALAKRHYEFLSALMTTNGHAPRDGAASC